MYIYIYIFMRIFLFLNWFTWQWFDFHFVPWVLTVPWSRNIGLLSGSGIIASFIGLYDIVRVLQCVVCRKWWRSQDPGVYGWGFQRLWILIAQIGGRAISNIGMSPGEEGRGGALFSLCLSTRSFRSWYVLVFQCCRIHLIIDHVSLLFWPSLVWYV